MQYIKCIYFPIIWGSELFETLKICISSNELVFPAFNIICQIVLDSIIVFKVCNFVYHLTLIQILWAIMNGVWSRAIGYTPMAGYAMWPIYLKDPACLAVCCHHALVLCMYIFISDPISLHKKTWLLLSLLWISYASHRWATY